MTSRRQNILLVGLARYGRDAAVLRGLTRYGRMRANWRFHDAGHDRSNLQYHLTHSQPDAMIAHVTDEQLGKQLSSVEVPVVDLSGYLPSDLAWPRIDERAIGTLAARWFLERGYRHFLYCAIHRQPSEQQRWLGYRDQLDGLAVSLVDHRRSQPETTVVCGDPRWRDLSLTGLLKQMPKPVATFTSTDTVGATLCDLIHDADIRIPDEAAVLGVDNIEITCQLSDPPLASIQVPGEKLGYEIARMLDCVLKRQPVKPLAPLQPIGVVERRSTSALAIDDPCIARAVAFMRKHATERITIGDVINAVRLPRSSFHVRFHKALHAAPGEVLRSFRLAEAMRRLAQTDDTVYAIALDSGFPDPEAMATEFRRHLKLTPSAYRKAQRI